MLFLLSRLFLDSITGKKCFHNCLVCVDVMEKEQYWSEHDRADDVKWAGNYIQRRRGSKWSWSLSSIDFVHFTNARMASREYWISIENPWLQGSWGDVLGASKLIPFNYKNQLENPKGNCWVQIYRLNFNRKNYLNFLWNLTHTRKFQLNYSAPRNAYRHNNKNTVFGEVKNSFSLGIKRRKKNIFLALFEDNKKWESIIKLLGIFY